MGGSRRANGVKFWKPVVQPAATKPGKKTAAPKGKKATGVATKPVKKTTTPKDVGTGWEELLRESYWPGQDAKWGRKSLELWATDLSAASRKTLFDLLFEVRKEVEKEGVIVTIVPSRIDPHRGFYWSDWAQHVGREHAKALTGREDFDIPQMIWIISLGSADLPKKDQRIEGADLWMGHYLKPKKAKEIGDILRKRFGRKFFWNGKVSQKMRVVI